MSKTEKEKKIILLTGASRGIGHATVRKFSEENWRVITCSRHAFDSKCPWPGGEDNHIQVDLSNPNNTIEAIEEVRKRLDGKLNALVNNAGISPKGINGKRLDTICTDLSTWGKVFHVNFFASVILARGLKKELLKARGAIVNVTSIAGSRVHPFAGAAYATSKAALGALTREMANDFGPLGVRVNAIAPGEVKTDILSSGTEKIISDIPMKRLGLPEEVADTIYY
ncbi:SDR family oxidoreductase, partial [Paracoccaceae bacterium]|nr:SDR family oxidoreductase [Paracoccaceae bacterium]